MSAAGRAAMRTPAFVSPITVWELVHKAHRGQLAPLPTIEGSFARHLAGVGFRVEPFQSRDAEIAGTLPPLHKDPMDRMLIGTALRTGFAVITSDRVLAKYGVATVW